MKEYKPKTIIQCEYDGGFTMPQICLSCGEPAHDKKWQVTATNFLKNQKVTFKFPVCDQCAEANGKYIDAVPVNIACLVILIFSVFSMFNATTKIPKTLYLIGGVIWMTLVIAYTIWTNIKAKRNNQAETITRYKNLKSAIFFKKISLPKRKINGEAIIAFVNKKFAKKFSSLNHGHEIKEK